MRHECEYLKYQHQHVHTAFEGTECQRAVLFKDDGHNDVVVLQVVMFCPYCGEDFRRECHWQIPGRPQENDILKRARLAGERNS